MHDLVLIDGSNFWYRAYLASLATGLDQPGGGLLIFNNMLKKVVKQFGKTNIVICWDSGDGGRKEIAPTYKAQRVVTSDVWIHLKLAIELVDYLGIKIAFLEGYEADDVIGSLAAKSIGNVRILSYDKDFYQLVSDTVKVFRPARKIHGVQKPDEIIGVTEVYNEFGVFPEKVPLLKAFLGDTSDNIPKLPIRLTANFKKVLINCINRVLTVEGVYDNLELFDDKFKPALVSFKEQATLSFKILKIQTGLTPKVIESEFDESLLEQFALKVNIKNLKIEEWKGLDSPGEEESSSQTSLF